MKTRQAARGVYAFVFLLFAQSVSADGQNKELGQALRDSPLFEMVDTLEKVDDGTKDQFINLLSQAIQRKLDAGRNNVIERQGTALRELATELYKDILTVDLERIPQDNGLRMKLGWTAMIVCASIPSDLAAEGLVRAIDASEGLDRFNDKRNDFVKLVYGLDGSGRPADFDQVVSRLSGRNKVEGELREKLIAHLISFAPEQTFRLVLERERKSLEDVADLSWFDRQIQEVKWLHRNGTRVPEGMAERLKADAAELLEHEVWWVRLYLIEVLTEHPNLAEEGSLEAMKDDPHPLIRARANALINDEG